MAGLAGSAGTQDGRAQESFNVKHIPRPPWGRRCGSARRVAAGSVRPASTTTGGETRVRKLCYRSVNASEKVQLPPASDVRHGDSACTELGVVDLLLAISHRHSRTCSGFANERYLLARERCVLVSDLHPPIVSYKKLRSLDTPQKKKSKTPLSADYVISPPSHFDVESRDVPTYRFEVVSSNKSNGFQPDAAAHNEFRRAFKGSTLSAQSSRRRIQSACFRRLRSIGALFSVDARSQVFP